MRNLTILFAVAAMLALAVPASGAWVYWGGSTDGLYSDNTKWVGGAKPLSWKSAGNPHDYACIGSGVCTVDTPEYPWDIFVGGAVENTVYVVIKADADLGINEFNVGSLDYGSYGFIHGGVEHQGGSVTNAFFGPGDYEGMVAQTGINIGSYEDAAGQSGTYVMTGGQINYDGFFRVGGANATGLFNVVGTGPTSIRVCNYTQGAKGTLQMDLVGGAVTPINVTLPVGTLPDFDSLIGQEGDVNLAEGCSLVLSGSTAVPVTIITYAGTLTGTFTNVTDGWDVDYSTPGVITVIPEPMTMSLLALGGLGVLLRRRRK